MLVFAIPTWNRADRLERSVLSMAEQIIALGADAGILISDNASDDNTPEVVRSLQARFPFIAYTRRPEHGDYHHNLEHMLPQLPGDYCWLFGDDDILLPGALQIVLQMIEERKPAFIHCGETTRLTGGHRVLTGTLIDLSNRYGWLELTGFMPSCVVRADLLRTAPMLPQWPLYCENAFPHACAILHQAANEQVLAIDAALVSTQGNSDSSDTLNRWAAENVAYKYFRVGDSLQAMIDAKAIPAKLDKGFFRYHRFYLWNRFINNLIHEIYNRPRVVSEDIWRRTSQLTGFLADRELARLIRMTIDQAREVSLAYVAARDAVTEADTRMRKLHADISAPTTCYAILDNETPPDVE